MSVRKVFIAASIAAAAAIAVAGRFWPPAYWVALFAGPVILLGIYDMLQTSHTIMRNYPLVGRGRYWMEILRPKMYQYFIESDLNGRPFNRIQRSVVYQRSKGALDTTPFGTQLDVYAPGYEWMSHSIMPVSPADMNHAPRVLIGGPDCKTPYSSSLLNISAMSFGALSANAVLALGTGAKLGGFALNTGEGGISVHHLAPGGDLVWQVGTGYFGCRDKSGAFSPEHFRENAARPSVKMIELKLSQGAKPGHGGILPAGKNTPEIAAIRGVEPYTRVDSPPGHSAFSTPVEMIKFIGQLRSLSGGKPVGFKLCVGKRSEFMALCKAMVSTGIKPDFITVDGGEGGTGAAPVEFSNSVGMPLKEGLAFVYDALSGHGLKRDVKIIASGKVIEGFDIVRNLALGADLCASARGMMLALGCIQALECNSNHCPTGITTHDPDLMVGLVVADKAPRVAKFHAETVKCAAELFAAAGFRTPEEAMRHHIFRRTNPTEVRRMDEIFPYIPEGSLLGDDIPAAYRDIMRRVDPASFRPRSI